MPKTDKVTYECRNGVAWITLNEPGVLNRIDQGPGSLGECLSSCLDRADADFEARCIVVTGAGRAFSSGGSPSGISGSDPLRWFELLENNAEANRRIRALRKPTIGAVNGICFGAALIMATHLDILVAGESAQFGLIETRFGSTGAQTLVYHVGPQWAKILALSGELISAAKAKEIGLVAEVCPDEGLSARVADLARRIASMPSDGVTINRRVINAAMDLMGWTMQTHVAAALNAIANSTSHDARSSNGRALFDVLAQEGWLAFKSERDAAFEPPWLGQ
jgi:enoyl-CoA hydratase/carnithine racemase